MLHLSSTRHVVLLFTNVQKPAPVLLRHDKLVQFETEDAPENIDLFQYDELSDHFQSKPTVELTSLPPTQQPLVIWPHSCLAKASS